MNRRKASEVLHHLTKHGCVRKGERKIAFQFVLLSDYNLSIKGFHLDCGRLNVPPTPFTSTRVCRLCMCQSICNLTQQSAAARPWLPVVGPYSGLHCVRIRKNVANPASICLCLIAPRWFSRQSLVAFLNSPWAPPCAYSHRRTSLQGCCSSWTEGRICKYTQEDFCFSRDWAVSGMDVKAELMSMDYMSLSWS